MGVEDLVDDEEIVVTMTRAGYIKAVSADAFRTQGRGGRGVQGARLKEEDLVDRRVHTSSHAYLLLFSNRGRVFRLRALRDPDEGADGQGHGGRQPVAARPREQIQAIIGTRDFSADQYLIFATKQGQVKKTAFSRVRQVAAGGVHRHQPARRGRAGPGGQTTGDDDVFMVTQRG